MFPNTSSPAESLPQLQLTKALWYEHHRRDLLAGKNYVALRKTYRVQKELLSAEFNGKYWDQQFAQPSTEQPIEEWRYAQVVKFLVDGKNVLNIGVGGGRLEEILAGRLPKLKYTGTDITRKALRQLQKTYPQWKFQYAELKQLPFAAETFEQVLFLQVLEHISAAETFSVLAELVRVLKKNGQAIMSVPLVEKLTASSTQRDQFQRLYSTALFRFELEEAGLEVVKLATAAAFAKHFKIKHLLNSLFHFRSPNCAVAVCRKKSGLQK